MEQLDTPKDVIETLKRRVLKGEEISFEEALFLIELPSGEDLQSLLKAAGEIVRHFHGHEIALCSLINAKSYLCTEDCGFCAQSLHFNTGAEQYPLVSEEEVLATAKRFESDGILDFCIVTSGAELKDDEFEKVLAMFQRLRRETKMNLDGSLGWLSSERIQRLKEAGVRRINNNLQTSRNYYSKIVSTHTIDKRIESLELLKAGGMEICSGGILAMGESRQDRVRLAFELKPYKPHCIPVNILNPRPGTPLENQPGADPLEMLKTIAVYRFIHPHANIKLAGGREKNLTTEDQKQALCSGANGLIVGGYLTSSGNSVQKDLEMLKQTGCSLASEACGSESSASRRQCHCGGTAPQ